MEDNRSLNPFFSANAEHGEDDEPYNSADDQDFRPDAQPEDDSSSDDEARRASSKKRSRQPDDLLDFDNSGDEATLAKARRKKGKNKHKSCDEIPDDEGGEGGLVKTRAQRKQETREKKALVSSASSSLDVDSLWAKMSAPSPLPAGLDAAQPTKSPIPESTEQQMAQPAEEPTDTVRIQRKFEFAGQVMQEEKVVSASSAEAKLYLQEKAKELERQQAQTTPDGSKPLRRPVKRKSMFAADAAPALAANGAKLNTLQKSKMDWATHVDKEGIADELDEHQRAKDSYTGRMDFLNRMTEKRDQDRST